MGSEPTHGSYVDKLKHTREKKVNATRADSERAVEPPNHRPTWNATERTQFHRYKLLFGYKKKKKKGTQP
jgi:hypothetical protein